jgi:hypothetical protein
MFFEFHQFLSVETDFPTVIWILEAKRIFKNHHLMSKQ